MDRGARWARVHGSQNQTRTEQLSLVVGAGGWGAAAGSADVTGAVVCCCQERHLVSPDTKGQAVAESGQVGPMSDQVRQGAGMVVWVTQLS